jgi:mono/diheme cytochrome c family protein
MLKGLLLGVLIAIVLMGCFIYFYFSTGRAPIATTDPPMPFEMKLAHMAIDARVEKQQIPPSPVAAEEKAYLSGAEVYKEHCAVCHGLPDQPKTFIAQGMFPPPPQLFHGTGVSDDPATETYWKVENGIRLTGMPGFKGRLTETQIWQVSVLLANSDKVPDSVKAALLAKASSAADAAAAPTPTMSGSAPKTKP